MGHYARFLSVQHVNQSEPFNSGGQRAKGGDKVLLTFFLAKLVRNRTFLQKTLPS